jgi:hypothetical protein
MKKFIIFVAAFAMVGSFVATAMADVSLYGSARFRTYYNDFSADEPGQFDDGDTEWRIGHLTRFGASFKSDKITGKFEMDARAGGAGSTGNIESDSGASRLGNMRLRLLWGEYDFGSWKFMIGQNYPLYDAVVSGINYYSGGFQKYGGIAYDVARTSQMRFTMNNLRIAFLPTDTSKGGVGSYTSDVDVIFPKIEVRYDLKADWGALNFIAGYQTYKGVDSFDADKTISSWVAGIRGKFPIGPAYFNAGLTYRQNGGNYGAWTTVNENAQFDGNDVADTTAWGAVAALGYKINDSNTIEASYGYVKAEQDLSGNWEDSKQAIGFMWKYTVAPGFYIVPEFIYQDNGKTTEDGVDCENGDNTILGVFWRIDFK